MSEERRYIKLDGSEQDEFYAIWSRSGRRLIVTVRRKDRHAQVELTPAQVKAVCRFHSDSLSEQDAHADS